MKIAIDITAITTARGNFGDKSGVYRYTLNLIKELANIIGDNQLYLLDFIGTGKLLIPSELLPVLNQKNVFYKSFSRPIDLESCPFLIRKLPGIRTIYKKINHTQKWNSFFKKINKYLANQKVDVIHFSDTVYFPTKCKNTLTIHDLVPFLFPELQQLETIKIHKRRLKFVKDHCDGVICVSKNTQKDFEKKCKNVYSKVIYEGSDDNFFKINKEKFISIKNKTSDTILKELEWKNYYLSYGTIEPRKNYGTLLSAYANLYFENKITKKLIIVGGKGWGNTYEKIQNFIKENSLEKQIIILDFVSDYLLNTIINGSYCLIYPSLYEGFGLPPLEAMNLEIPTITSNTSSLPEVVGDEAFTFNPLNIKELEKQILLLEDSKKYKKQIDYSTQRSKLFSWKKTAKETLNFYQKIINDSH